MIMKAPASDRDPILTICGKFDPYSRARNSIGEVGEK